tara:strand:- start:165 stop:320 length:156 start_codon:yes stop_codon:yes gene_type:complete
MFPAAIPLLIPFNWVFPFLPGNGVLTFVVWLYAYGFAIMTAISYFLEFKCK